jgi:hypothetical protein
MRRAPQTDRLTRTRGLSRPGLACPTLVYATIQQPSLDVGAPYRLRKLASSRKDFTGPALSARREGMHQRVVFVGPASSAVVSAGMGS